LPHLENLILTNNNIEDLTEIDQLSTIKTLKSLSLLRNPVAALKHYRLYTIYRIPSLRILDFKKVKDVERKEASKLYKGKKLKQSNDNSKPKTFTPGDQLDKLTLNNNTSNGQQQQQQQQQKRQSSKEDIAAIRVELFIYFNAQHPFGTTTFRMAITFSNNKLSSVYDKI
jgi:U2 small nuclear ribonucleoprotein A'